MASVPLGRSEKDMQGNAVPAAMPGCEIRSTSWIDLCTPDFLAEWGALAAAVSEPNPFYENWNLKPALEIFDPGSTVELVHLRSGGQLTALLPIIRSNSYYRYPIPHLAGWTHDNAFCGAPLVRHGFETQFWQELARWAGTRTRHMPFLHLYALPENSTLFSALETLCAEGNLQAAIVHREDRAMLQSGYRSEDYFVASMSGKKRKELRRQFNRLSDLGDIVFERRADTQDLSQWIDSFLALESAGWKGRESSALASDTRTRRMFHQTVRGAAEAGKLERLALKLDGQPIALLANYLTPPGAFSFKTAFDEDYARFSPGVLLQRENLKLLDHGNIEWTDSCASADHPMIERIWREKRSMVRVNIAIGGALRQATFKHLVRSESGSEMIGV